MKALTICQPYAHLIMSGDKRVENRTWCTRYRGCLLIHAGRNRSRLRGADPSPYVFGALLGVAELVDCLPIDSIDAGLHDERFPWLREHEHTKGPWCWLLANVRSFADPIPWKGGLGIFEVPNEAVGTSNLRAA